MPQNIPWKTIPSDLGDVPFYVIQFDKTGACTSPEALDELVGASAAATDVIMFSHGWNNDWAAATARYDRFLDRFLPVRKTHWAAPDRPFRPVLAGVVWPSTALVAPWERGPDIAGLDPLDDEAATLADAMSTEDATRLRAILAERAPTMEQAAEAADLVASALAPVEDELGQAQPSPDGPQLLATWTASERPTGSTTEPGGFIEDETDLAAEPEAAVFNPFELIRKGIRLATVQQMKDRAGVVGAEGVATALRRLSDAGDARISLIGHSYGAKVVLSAVCAGSAPSRLVDSVLLLQPALSCYAFADDIEGRRGGYRSALDRIRQPLITTRSVHDSPLTKYFHLAVRRKSDLGEAVQIAGQPPSKFAALGGYGPQLVPGGAEELDEMPSVGDPYPLSTARRIIAVDGSSYIKSHGAVETPETAWALLSQLKG